MDIEADRTHRSFMRSMLLEELAGLDGSVVNQVMKGWDRMEAKYRNVEDNKKELNGTNRT